MLRLLLLAACSLSGALVVAPPRPALCRQPHSSSWQLHLALRRPHSTARQRRVLAQADDGKFDTSGQQFDLLSLRSFRRDTILQYDATNQSEPLRIALTLLGILFSLSIPALATELGISDDLTANVAAVLGTGISGGLFQRNRGFRQARMEKIELEYAMGDLRAKYRGVRTSSLKELRGKRRVVVVAGAPPVVDAALAQAFVYRRRLTEAEAVVVPVYTSGGAGAGAPQPLGESESKWLWAAAEPGRWNSYFDELLSARGMAMAAEGAWIGLNLRGRTFGSAQGAPKWDEILGTALQPVSSPRVSLSRQRPLALTAISLRSL